MCATCDEQTREIAKLRQDLATRDAEVRELRSAQREQVRTVQESAREVTRVKAKARRLATQAEAASYIAEVEVAEKALRGSLANGAAQPLLLLARTLIESTAEPFARGDYGGAMDRAAQAEQLVAVVSEAQSTSKPRGETPLQTAIPFKLAATASLRREPLPKAPVIAVLQKDIALTAYAYKGAWMRVATDDGRAGWVLQSELGVR